MRKLKLLAISAIAIAVVAGTTLGLTIVFNGNGTLQVDETITVAPLNLDVVLEPNAVIEKTVVISNNGSTAVDVIATADVVSNSPPGPYAGVTVTPSQTVTIGPGQTANLIFTIIADNGIQAGTGSVALSVIRP